MTEAEKAICKLYLEELDKHHTCNEYRLFMQMLEQEPCDDCISRGAVLDIIDNYSDSQSNVGDVTQDCISDVIALPPVKQQEPTKVGHWAKESPPMVERYPFCSECGFVNPFENALNYCPNCGAKMEG